MPFKDPEAAREWRRQDQQRKRDVGECSRCKQPRVAGSSYCKSHKKTRTKYEEENHLARYYDRKENDKCVLCGSESEMWETECDHVPGKKNGKARNGSQRYECRICGKNYTEGSQRRRVRCLKCSLEQAEKKWLKRKPAERELHNAKVILATFRRLLRANNLEALQQFLKTESAQAVISQR